MIVVADTNVVVSAVFWPGDSRRVLALWARRRFSLAATASLFEEYCEVSSRLARKFPEVNPQPWLNWIQRKARFCDAVAVGKQRSRDPDDDSVLACALASQATFLVSKDDDLLSLHKPFGIEVLSPSQLLARLRPTKRK